MSAKAVEAHRDGRYREGLEWAKKAYEYAGNHFEPDHPNTLTGITNLAGLYKSQERYREAEPLFKEVLEKRRKILRVNHPSTLRSMNSLASLYTSQGRYGEAEPLFKETLEKRREVLGMNHPDTLTSMNNLASLYQSQGRYGEAELLFKEALEKRRKVSGLSHSTTLTSMNNLAALYHAQGRYGETELLHKEVLEKRREMLGLSHPATLVSMNNLAALYHAQRRHREAESLYKEVLERYRKVLGVSHSTTLKSIHNLANLYRNQNRYLEAKSLYKELLEKSREVLGEDHPDTLLYMSNFASSYTSHGRYEESELSLKEVLEKRREILGLNHPSTLNSMNSLTDLYHTQERYIEAEPLYKEILEKRREVLGTSHPHTLTVQLNYITLLINLYKERDALLLLKNMEAHLFTYIITQLDTLSKERVRRRFQLSTSLFQNIVFSLAHRKPSSETTRFAARVLLQWKQIQAEEEAYIAQLVRTTQDPRIRTAGEKVIELRTRLSRLTQQPEAESQSPLSKTLSELERVEVELQQLSRHYRGRLAVSGVTLDGVWSQLPADSTLLEFRQYNPVAFNIRKVGNPHWMAYLLRADGEAPILQDLGPVEPTRKLWNQLRSAGHDKAKADQAARELYQSLFGTFESKITDLKTLFIAPDGFLHLVPLTRLILPDGRYWIERQAIHQLQTGRDLLRQPLRNDSNHFLALGGVDFHQNAEVVTSEPEVPRSLFASVNRQTADEIKFFKPLPASGEEADEIALMYRLNRKAQAEVWPGLEASEARLKALESAPKILHLATHGFYLRDRPLGAERPLVLSGLSLAGANQGLRGQIGPDGEDGILYSLEVLGLNLHGTELVSLSACNTGQGVVDYAEGVYGLVRAFCIAGARRVLMTLWPVGDDHAKDFMVAFYERWLQQPVSDPAKALRETYLAYIRHPDPELRNPRVWAPYVLVGN
ncbi:CHAT domain-containing tetratricopeptide repeat protein [Candidatus Entotheonella palauensis]|uniref:CHAT domain-containing tetratricopeptide repeat protein n=1 Tax=Candidatus Entotheonella palauensis TaxID=93172 RepID=UPI000B7C6BDF|nr:CHAT domain-containing tetratricopeptide repeat protein [Candidatus Entotheonella palauensis]